MPLVPPTLPTGLWGSNLRTARERTGKSRGCLAKLVNRCELTVGRWEAGTRTPSPADRLLLADALGMPVEALFPAEEPLVIIAARSVAAARTIPELQRAVAQLRGEFETLDAINERGSRS